MASAQTDGEAPDAPVAGEPEVPPEVGTDPVLPTDPEERGFEEEDEDEVAEPEPEVSEPEPEVSEPASELGRPDAEPAIEEDLAEANREVAPESRREGETVEEIVEEEEVSTADRLASVAGGVGLPWTAPLTWTHNLSARTLAPNGQLTYDPFYSWSFSLRPRWIFDHGTSVGARQNLDVELTEANGTVHDRQLIWSDTQVDATFTLPWKPLDFIISPALTMTLPVSLASRGASRVLGPGIRLLSFRAFSVGQGLILGFQGSYTGWIRHGERQSMDGPGAPPPGDRGANSNCTPTYGPGQSGAGVDLSGLDCNVGGPGANDHTVSAALFGTFIPIDRLAINLSVAYIWAFDRDLGTDCVDTLSGPVCRGDGSATKQNTLLSFSMSVGYDFTPYFTGTIGYGTFTSAVDSDGGREQLFFNENSQLFLSLQFRPAALIAHRRAKAEAEAELSEEEQARNVYQAFSNSRL